MGPCELFLHERLLSSARRTTNPEEADYFFVPAWGQVAKFGGNYRYRGGQWGYWQAVRDYIENTYPFWSWKGGADHIWVMMGDHGACEAPRGHGIPTAVLPSILLSNWGLTTDTAATGLRAYLDKGPCFRPGQDIVIPAPLNSNHMNSPFRRASSAPPANPSRDAPPRTQLMFFKGRIKWGGGGAVILEDGVEMYSHGVRQRLFDLYQNDTDILINRPGSSASKAKFCLAAAGLGFGVRVHHCIADGSIPLILQDNVTQQYEYEFLPYDLFTVRLPEADIPILKERLLAYSDEDIAAMQAELKCAWPWMIWSSVYGSFGDEDGSRDAFEALLGTLQMRRDGIPPRRESMCNYESPRIARSQRACHMYCDTAPSAPASDQCRQQTRANDSCVWREWMPSWQPWPPGGAAQT